MKRIPLISIAILVIGAALRIAHYALNRSLWLDEAMLAKHVTAKGFLELLRPLEDQAAPITFLWFSRLSVVTFGRSEFALRLVPLLCGLASLPLLYFIAKRFLSGWLVPIACAAFSFSPVLVFYSEEFKQYSGDVFAALALTLLGLIALDEGNVSRRSVLLLCLAGGAAVFFSYPSLFILAGIGLTLLAAKLLGNAEISFSRLVVIATVWLGCAGINYFFFLRGVYAISGIEGYWREGFLPLPLSIGAVKTWAIAGSQFLTYAGFHVIWQGLLIALITIAVFFAITDKKLSTILFGCYFAFAQIASLLGKFPFRERQVLFLIPFVALLVAKGVEVVAKQRLALVGALAICLIAPSLNSLRFLTANQMPREEIKPLLSYLDAHRQPSDGVYVYYGAAPAVRYYQPPANYHFGIASRLDRSRYLDDLKALESQQRVWLLFSHVYQDEDAFMVSQSGGQVLETQRAHGASLYLVAPAR